MVQAVVHVVVSSDEMATKLSLLRKVFELPLTGVLSGIVVGAYFGRLATYGSLASQIAKDRIVVRVHPGHFDGANGLRPIGNFYLFQAMLTAIPLLWLAGWAIAMPTYLASPCLAEHVSPGFAQTVQWQFFGQWLVVAFFTHLGFVRPVIELRRKVASVHQTLLNQRIPAIEEQVKQMNSTWSESNDDAEKKRIETELLTLSRERWHIQNMSFWPMDRNMLRKYLSIELASSVLPVAIGPFLALQNAGGASGRQSVEFWSELIAAIAKIFR